ncbi:putative actinidain [Helianthus annuus]|nr:putative actinidain [Helianthus annuus]KAJ0745941.1 putative actinidain [Helianthus annuus]
METGILTTLSEQELIDCDKGEKAATIDGFCRVRVNNELAIKRAVARQPVVVGIEVSGLDLKLTFFIVQMGIFRGKVGTRLNHQEAIIGYGIEKGVDYWLLKNSWGPKWAENGYFRIEQNVREIGGKCGVAMRAFFLVKIWGELPFC